MQFLIIVYAISITLCIIRGVHYTYNANEITLMDLVGAIIVLVIAPLTLISNIVDGIEYLATNKIVLWKRKNEK